MNNPALDVVDIGLCCVPISTHAIKLKLYIGYRTVEGCEVEKNLRAILLGDWGLLRGHWRVGFHPISYCYAPH